MANIKKGARAYYADTDYRRDGTIEAYNKIDNMPAIVANPEGTPSAELNTLSIGDTIYKVNDVRVSKILALRFTIDNGGIYNAKMPIVSFVNEYGEAAQVPTYNMTCDKPLQYGNLYLNGDAGVRTQNLPAIFNVLFNAEFNIEDFANIKLENSGLFPGDIAKNIKLEYSVNNTDWLEIFDKVSIDWTGDSHIYDMSTGEEITTKSPIPEPTAADAGKMLTVDSNGAWELDNIPSELPAVTSADAGKVLSVDSNGEWGANAVSSNNIKFYRLNQTSSNSLTLRDSKTCSDIVTDLKNNKMVVLGVTETKMLSDHNYATLFYVSSGGKYDSKITIFTVTAQGLAVYQSNGVATSDISFNLVTS